eukprot:1925553-Pyramimonas_sp.AAC.1
MRGSAQDVQAVGGGRADCCPSDLLELGPERPQALEVSSSLAHVAHAPPQHVPVARLACAKSW